MTIASPANRNDFIGDDVATVFPYTYRIFTKTDLLVTQRVVATTIETTLAVDADYTVAGVGDLTGGSITLLAGALPIGTVMTVRRVRPLTQLTDIKNGGDFFPEAHEDTFDHLVMLAQQLDNENDRAMRLPETVSPDDVDTTLPVPESDNFIKWNTAADALENATLAAIGTLVITSTLGIMVQSTANVFSARTLVPNEGLEGTDLDGVLGDPTFGIAASGVTTSKLDALAVTAVKLAADAVETAKIKDLAVTTAKLAASGVTAPKIAADAIITSKILDKNVTEPKLADDAVSGRVLQDGIVSAVHLAPGAIDASVLGPGAFTRAAQSQTTVGNTAAPVTVVTKAFASGAVTLGDMIIVRGWFTTFTNGGSGLSFNIRANGTIIASFVLAFQSNGIDEVGYLEAKISARSLTVVTSYGTALRWAGDFPEGGAAPQELFSRDEAAVADISANALTILVEADWVVAPSADPSVKEANWTIDLVKSV